MALDLSTYPTEEDERKLKRWAAYVGNKVSAVADQKIPSRRTADWVSGRWNELELFSFCLDRFEGGVLLLRQLSLP